MSADKIKKIDFEVKEIHTQIKKSNLILRQRIKDIQQDMKEWEFLGGTKDEKGDGTGYMH